MKTQVVLSQVKKMLLSGIAIVFAGVYPLSYVGVTQPFLRTAVLAGMLAFFIASWYRWIWCIYIFIFCIPLFNTLPTILHLPAPFINVNYVLLSALLSAWALRAIWRKPLSDRAPNVYCCSTPFDLCFLVVGASILMALLPGWLRFNNALCLGFYTGMPYHFARIPFFTLFDNYLCFTRAWQLTQLGLSLYMLCSSIRHRHELRNVLWLTLAASFLVSMYGLYQYVVGVNWVGINWFFRRINSTFNGPHALGMYLATIMALGITLMIATQSTIRRVLLFICTVCAGGALWLTGTRSAAFSLVLVFGVVGVLFWIMGLVRSRHVRTVSLLIAAVLLFIGPGYSLVSPERGLFSVVLASPQYQRFTENMNNQQLNRAAINKWLAFRFFHWIAAARVIQGFPVIGSGIGTFDKLYREVRLSDDSYKTAYAHSFYLDVLSELGLPALLAVIAGYCVAIILSWKLYRARDVSWRWKLVGLGILLAFCTTYIANFVTSDVYYVPEIQLWCAVLLALLVCNYQINFDPEPQSLRQHWRMQGRRMRAFLRAHALWRTAAIAAAALLVLVWLANVGAAMHAGYRFFHEARPYTLLDRIPEYGIYDYQRDAASNKYARTARVVYKPIRVKNRYMRIFLRAEHPDAERRPVPVSLALDDTLLGSVLLSNRHWKLVRFDLQPWRANITTNAPGAEAGIPAVLHMRSGRVWNPYRANVGRDNRPFGVNLGAIEWGYF